MDEAIKREMNLRNKEAGNNQVKHSKDMAKTATKMTALETKKEKMESKQRNMNQRAYEEAKARERKNMIQAQKMAAAQQRDQDFMQRQQRTRDHLEEKLNKEAQDQRDYELKVAQMEKEELELIMRLKNTKIQEE